MLYNSSIQDELEHSYFNLNKFTKTETTVFELEYNLKSAYNSIQRGIFMDKEILKVISKEAFPNRNKTDPISRARQEKANSDILISSPDMVNLSPEASMKLLDFKENSAFWNYSFHPQNNIYNQNIFLEASLFSKFLYDFSLTNIKGNINEEDSVTELEKKLSDLKIRLNTNEKLLADYFRLIPILEEFSALNMQDIESKYYYLNEIRYNIQILIGDSIDILIKIQPMLKSIFKNIEKLIIQLESKTTERKESKDKFLIILKLMYTLAFCFKFSYGFLLVSKYIRKYDLSNSFDKEISKDFYELFRLRENTFCLNNSEPKNLNCVNWNTSQIEFPIKKIFTVQEELQNNLNEHNLWEIFANNKDTTIAVFANNIFLYNDIFGLINLNYSESENSLSLIDYNHSAFNLTKGIIVALGNEEAGTIVFLANYFFSDFDYEIEKEKRSNAVWEETLDNSIKKVKNIITDEELEEIEKQEKAFDIIFSQSLNINSFEFNLQRSEYKNQIKRIFENIRFWLADSLKSREPFDEKNFVYTSKNLLIPKEHFIPPPNNLIFQNSKDNIIESTYLKELLKYTKIYIKGNLIFCLRPILKLKQDKKYNQIYFSQKYIFVLDILEFTLDEISSDSFKHLKSIVLRNETNSSLHGLDLKSQKYKNLDCFLDNFINRNCKNFLVSNGKLILMNNNYNLFIYDLYYDFIEYVDTIEFGEEDKIIKHENNLCFVSKNNHFVLLSEKIPERNESTPTFKSAFDTLRRKINMITNFNNENESIFYEILEKQTRNITQNGKEEFNITRFINKNYINKDKNDNSKVKQDGILLKSENNNLSTKNSFPTEALSEKISTNNNDSSQDLEKNQSSNFLLFLLSNLAKGANAKIDKTSNSSFEKLLCEAFLSYNDTENLEILFELIPVFFTDFLKDPNEELLQILFSLITILKLHVFNNSKLELDFSIYFTDQNKLEETLLNLFNILTKLILNYQKYSCNKNKVYESLCKNLLETLTEMIAFIYKEKEKFTNIMCDFIQDTELFNYKFSDFLSSSQEKKTDYERFNLKMKFCLIKAISNLFINNSNYIFCFILNDNINKFIIDIYSDLFSVNKEIAKNKLSIDKNKNTNEISKKSIIFKQQHEIDINKIETYLLTILNSIIVKILNININFGKKKYEQNLEKILKNISDMPNMELIDIENQRIISFLVSLSKNICETANCMIELHNTKKSKLQNVDNHFVFLSINVLFNYINLINFETFPEIVFGNWFLILNLLKNLINNLKYNGNIIPINADSLVKSNRKNYLKMIEDKTDKEFFELRYKTGIIDQEDIQSKKSNLCSNKVLPLKRFDFLIDNNLINDVKQKEEFQIELTPDYLLENSHKEIKEDILYDIYFELSYLNTNESRKEKFFEVYEIKQKQKVKLFEHSINKGIKTEYFILKEINVNSNIIIKFYNVNLCLENFEKSDSPDSSDTNSELIVYRLRVSNYQIFYEDFNLLLTTIKNFTNKSIKYLTYYENANISNNLNLNEDVKDLISSSLFSNRIKDCSELINGNNKLRSIDKDLFTFFTHLDEKYIKKFEFLKETSGTESNEISAFEQNALKKEVTLSETPSIDNSLQNINLKFINKFLFEIKSNNIDFESIINIRDYDYTGFENKNTYSEISNLDKKDLFLFKKLFSLFDFIIEKVNREYIIKGELLDKIVYGIFFIVIKHVDYFEKIENIFSYVFYKDENFSKFTNHSLKKEEVIKLLEIKDFEQVFFIWKNACQIRKIYKTKKDLIFQQMDENFHDEKTLELEFEKSDNDITKIKCDLDPTEKEDKNVLKYFERYLEKLKLIYYLKCKEINNTDSDINRKRSTSKSFKFSNQLHNQGLELKKKNSSSYMKNLIRKTLIKEDFESNIDSKGNKKGKNKMKIKNYMNNIISAITNDKINVNNILACFQNINVKIKFREISLVIINDIIKSIENNEIKASLISNFYQNFNGFSSSNQLPNILDNINISSTKQSELITNLFHELLFNIIEEINSLYNTTEKVKDEFDEEKLTSDKEIFWSEQANTINYMTVLLNTLLWNIKGRNFQFLIDTQFFQTLFNNQKNKILKLARKAMFLDPKDFIYDSDLSTTLSIITIMDVYHISSLLTEILKTYSILIIKRVVKENNNSNTHNQNNESNNKSKNFALVKSVSNLDFLNHNELIVNIMEIYQIILDEFNDSVLFEKKENLEKKYKIINLHTILNNYKDDQTNNNMILKDEENSIFLNNLIFNQKKLSNILINLIRLIIIQDPSINFIFKDLSLFSRILDLSIFANEKNIYLILNIIKILMRYINNNPEDFDYWSFKIKEFYKNTITENFLKKDNKIKSSEDLLSGINNDEEINSMENLEFFIKFILSLNTYISRIRNNNSINKDLIIFEQEVFSASNNIINLIDNSIEEKIYDFLRFFIMQSYFKDQSIKIISQILEKNKYGGVLVSKILDSSIGYIHNFCKVICNSKLKLNNCQTNKYFDSSDIYSLVKKGYLIYEKTVYHLDEEAQESNNGKYPGIENNNTEDCIVKCFLEENSINLINQIEINSPNLQFPFISEIIIDDEHCDQFSMINVEKNFIEKILMYLEENLINKNICMLTYLQSFIRIAKFIKKLTLFIENELEIRNHSSLVDNNSKEFYEKEEENEIINKNNQVKKIENFIAIKSIIANFISRNTKFFEYFLTFELEKTPVNLFSIDKIENLFFSYKPYDIKMLSKEKKENILIFKNPIKISNKNIKLFPYGNDSIPYSEEISKENTTLITEKKKDKKNIEQRPKTKDDNSENSEKSKSTIGELLKVGIDYEKRTLNISQQGKLIQDFYFNYYQIIKEDTETLKRIDMKIEIFDKEKAKEILEKFKTFEEVPIKKESGNYAIFLTNDFIETLGLKVEESIEIEEYLQSIKDKFESTKDEASNNTEIDTNQSKLENKKEASIDKKKNLGETNQNYKEIKEKLINDSENQIREVSIKKNNDKIIVIENNKENSFNNKINEVIFEDKEETKIYICTKNIEDENQSSSEEKRIDEEDKKANQSNINTPPFGQIKFENYIKAYHISETNYPVFIVSDEIYNSINKNFNCLGIDYELLDDNLRQFLISPKITSLNLKEEKENSDNDSMEKLKQNMLLEEFVEIITDASHKNLSKNEEMNKKLKEDLKIFKLLNECEDSSNLKKVNQENDEEEDQINECELYEGYLNLLKIENVNQKSIPDSRINDKKTFETLITDLELIRFQDQKESHIKNLGFHILKQHLRFLNIYYNKKYFENIQKDEEIVDSNFYNQLMHFLKYLKLLYFQSNFKERYFGLKLENQFLKSKIILIIQKLLKSKKTKYVKNIFNLEELKIITYKDPVSSENELNNSDFLFFLEELMQSINIGNYKISNKDKSGFFQKNTIQILKILSLILKSSIDNLDYSKIVSMLEIFTKFLDNSFLFINNNKENYNNSLFKMFIIGIIQFFINDPAFKILMKTQLGKLNFSNYVLEFALKFIKFYEASIKILEFPKEIKKKTEENFAKDFFYLSQQLDIVEHKLKSEKLLNLLIESSSFYKSMICKKHKLPNLLNLYCFTLKPSIFKDYELSFSNMDKKLYDIIFNARVSYNLSKGELESETIDICGHSDKLNYKSTISINQDQTINDIKAKDNLIKNKNLIFNDCISKIDNKNFAIIGGNEGTNPFIFNLPKSLQKIYSLNTKSCLVYQNYNKFYFKGKLEKLYLDAKTHQKIEDLERKGEKIIKFFDRGILVTDKFLHLFFKFQVEIDDIDSDSDSEGDNDIFSTKLSFENLFDPYKIEKAHASEYGILLSDSDNNIYFAGEIIFNINDDYIEYSQKLKKLEIFDSKLKIIDIGVSKYCSVYLIKDPKNGKNYLYSSGISQDNLNLVPASQRYMKNERITSLNDTPIKKFNIITNKFLIALSEENQIYFSGKFSDLNFNKKSKTYVLPQKWDWPAKNGYEVLDYIDPGCDAVIFRVKNLKNNQEELFMVGQVYLFNNCEAKFILFDEEPFKINFQDLFQKRLNKEQLQSKGDDGKQDCEKQEKDLKEADAEQNSADLDEEQKKLILELEAENNDFEVNSGKDIDTNLNNESVKDNNNICTVSRYALNKLQSNIVSLETKNITNNREAENNNKEDMEANFIKEYGKEKILELNINFKLLDIKIGYGCHDKMKYYFAYVLGHEIDETQLNLDLLKEKYANEVDLERESLDVNQSDKNENKVIENVLIQNEEIAEEEKELNLDQDNQKTTKIKLNKTEKNLSKSKNDFKSERCRNNKNNKEKENENQDERSEKFEVEKNEVEEFNRSEEEVDTEIKISKKDEHKDSSKTINIDSQKINENNKEENPEGLKGIKIKHLKHKTVVLVIYNKNNILENYLYSKKEDFVYVKLKIYQDSEAYLLNSEVFTSLDKLLSASNEIFKSSDDFKKNVNLLEKQLKDDALFIDNLRDGLCLSSKLCKLLSSDPTDDTIKYISENLDELIHILFLSDDLIIYKKIKSETFFYKNSKSDISKNIELTQTPKDSNLDELLPDVRINSKEFIKSHILTNLNSLILKEYKLAKYNFLNLKQTQRLTYDFSVYLEKNYKNSETFLNVFTNKDKVEVIDKIVQIYSDCIQYLMDTINLEYENSLSKLVKENINLLERSVKEYRIEQEIEKLKLSKREKTICVDRTSAKKFEQLGICDKKFEKTIFSQVYRETKKWKLTEFQKVKNQLFFKVDLKGEDAHDAGGPGREIFTQIFEDLMSNRHDLFIQTPNQKTKSGLGRDLWTINPSANTVYHLNCFEFIGKIFAYAVISKVYCPINLPKFVWKQILGLQNKPSDIQEIDIVAYNSIVKICLNPEKYKNELNALFDYATFTACLSNGEEIELIEDGRNVNINPSNFTEYIKLYTNARYREVKEQANAILKGIKCILPINIIHLLSADDLSERVAGPKTFDMDLLKRNTHYVGYKSTDKVIQYFWKFLDNCTIEEKIQYLRFVWGRTTLPNSDKNFDQKHGINKSYESNDALPLSHTCFFEIDLPEYSSFEQLKSKLSYAMNNSYVISDGDTMQLNFD